MTDVTEPNCTVLVIEDPGNRQVYVWEGDRVDDAFLFLHRWLAKNWIQGEVCPRDQAARRDRYFELDEDFDYEVAVVAFEQGVIPHA